MKSVIFDLDGTLADTSRDLLAAANACFRSLGHGDLLDWQTDQGTALRGGRAMLTLGFSRIGPVDQDLVDAQYKPLLGYYAEHLDDHTVMYDGAVEALDELANQGYALGICTNKPYYLAQELMVRLGHRDRFGALLGADSLPVRKPDPKHLFETIKLLGSTPEKSVLIGDTATDRDTSRNAGVPSILVGFGPSGEDMGALNPEAILHDYKDLPDMVGDVIERGVL